MFSLKTNRKEKVNFRNLKKNNRKRMTFGSCVVRKASAKTRYVSASQTICFSLYLTHACLYFEGSLLRRFSCRWLLPIRRCQQAYKAYSGFLYIRSLVRA